MANFNKVMLMGNLTRDPEKRYTKGDQPVARFSVACNRTYTDRQTGEKKQMVSFVPVVVWGKQAENCSQYLQKGSPVFIEGRLQSRSWETSDGQKRNTLEVIASAVQFLNRAPKRQGDDYSQVAAAAPPDEEIAEDPPNTPSEDDVPF
ncbi:MAG: single-stranded DNA-binding protein [bacterium]